MEFGGLGKAEAMVVMVGIGMDSEALVVHDMILGGFVSSVVLKPAGTVWATRSREGTEGAFASRDLFRIAEITGRRSNEETERDCFTFSKTIHDV